MSMYLFKLKFCRVTTYDFVRVQSTQKVAWKFCIMVDGAQFAMIVGVLTMPMSCVDRWDLEQPLKQFIMPNLDKASERFVTCYGCSF